MKITRHDHLEASIRLGAILGFRHPPAILNFLESDYRGVYEQGRFIHWEVDERNGRIVKDLVSPYYKALWKMHLLNDEILRNVLERRRK